MAYHFQRQRERGLRGLSLSTSVRARLAWLITFNVSESAACVAYHFPTLCEDGSKTKGAGISKHFRERVWVEVCHRAGVHQSIC